MTGGMGARDLSIVRRTPLAALGVAAVAVAGLCRPEAARAGLASFQFPLGQQDFAGDNTSVFDGQIHTAGAGEPYPFDGSVFGDDRSGKLGSLEFTQPFDAATLLGTASGMRSAS